MNRTRTVTRRRNWGVGLASSLAMLTLAACGSSSSTAASSSTPTSSASSTTSTATTAISLGLTLPTADYTPVYVAQQEGFFKQHHLKVSFDSFTGGGSTVAAALASNSVQIVLGGIDLLAPDAKGEIHVKFFSELSGFAYAIYASKGITSASQLVGKKVGTSSLSSLEYIYWHIALKSLGMNPSSVHYVIVSGGSPKFAALETGAVNAVIDLPVSAPPGASKYLLVSPSKLPQVPVALFAANDSFISAHPQAMKDFTDAINEAVAWLKVHPNSASKICQSSIDLKPSQCVMANYYKHPGNLTASPYDWSKTGAVDVKALTDLLPAVAAVDPAVSKLTVKDILTTQFTGTSPS